MVGPTVTTSWNNGQEVLTEQFATWEFSKAVEYADKMEALGLQVIRSWENVKVRWPLDK